MLLTPITVTLVQTSHMLTHPKSLTSEVLLPLSTITAQPQSMLSTLSHGHDLSMSQNNLQTPSPCWW